MTDAIIFKVEYLAEVFDLTVPEATFEFTFQLYNFLSAAKAVNDGFHNPESRLALAKDSVDRKNYPALSSKRKHDESDQSNDSDRTCDPPAHGGAQDSFNNPSVQRELTRAGYTLTQPISEISDELELLTPVSCNSLCCTR